MDRDGHSAEKTAHYSAGILAAAAASDAGAGRSATLPGEACFTAFFENSPHDLFVLDVRPDGRFVFEHINPALTRSTGYTREMLIGRTPEDVLTPGNIPMLEARYRACVETRQRVEYDVVAVTPIGEVRRHTILVPIVGADGVVSKILGTSTDVTALRDTEAKLASQTQELRELVDRLLNERALSDLIIESSGDGIIVVDTELRYLVWNPAIEGIHGKTRDEVLGKTVFDVDPGFATHQVGDAWRNAISGQRAEIRDFRFFSRARSAEVTYDADFTPLYSPAGAIVGAICMLHETTERRRAEETLRQAQKMEAIGQLTAGVAHDFNNILQVILGNLTIIQNRFPQGSDASRLAPLVAAAIRAGDRAATLTAQLLAFSRRQPLQPKELDINRLLAGMSELLHRSLTETIEVETVLAEGVWQTMADANQLENAVLNLAVNARDAMPGGGKLTIETANAAFDEADAANEPDLRVGEYVVIAVTDTGTGMLPEVAAKAFDPFFTTKDIGQGTGLGLAQVYGFIKQSGGHARIISAPGAGTTVKLYLPRLASSTGTMAAPAAAEGANPQRGRETILVVEDEDDVRGLVVGMLHELGYEVLQAGDGQTALEILEKRRDVRLLFTDVGLPGGISGRELANRARVARPNLSILYTTGYARDPLGHQGRLDPGVEVINKPFTYAALAARIREVLDKAP